MVRTLVPLVVAGAIFAYLGWVQLDKAGWYIVEHEIVDLAEETIITKLEAERDISRFRMAFDQFISRIESALADSDRGDPTAQPSEFFKSETDKWFHPIKPKSSDDGAKDSSSPAELTEDSSSTEGILCVEFFDATNEEPTQLLSCLNNRPSTSSKSEAGGPQLSPPWIEVLEFETPRCQQPAMDRAMKLKVKSAILSDFDYAQIRVSHPNDDTPQNEPVLVIQAVRRFTLQLKTDPSHVKNYVAVATQHVQVLDCNWSDWSNQAGVSSRTFQVLRLPGAPNDVSRILQRPDQTFDALMSTAQSRDSGTSTVDANLTLQFARQDSLFDVNNRESRSDSRKTYGISHRVGDGDLARVQGLPFPGWNSQFVLSNEIPLEEALWFDPAEMNDQDKKANREEFRREFESELQTFLRNRFREGKPASFVDFPTSIIRRFKVRSQSESIEHLEPVKAKINQLLEKYSRPRVSWTSPTHLHTFATHTVQIDLAGIEGHDKSGIGNEGQHRLDLVRGVAIEELRADVVWETRWIRNVANLALISVLIAGVLFAGWINRDLKAITHSVHGIADGDFQRLDVLPVKNRTEVGELARSFHHMAVQLQESLNESKRLASELQRERDSLDMHVKQRTEQLHEANISLVQARDAAMAGNRAKGEFLASTSHELRTPLNGIIGYGELLIELFDQDESAKTQYGKDVQKIVNAGKHLLALVNDILDISKIEAGKLTLSQEPFRIRDVIESVVATVQPMVEKNSNTLTVNCTPDVAGMVGDSTRTGQILFNLLSNACKFTSSGKVELTVSRVDVLNPARIQFSVRDSGIGIAADQLGKLFQNFHQADASTTRRFGGTGLGLAITKRICELMGGQIWVESELGKGSVFTVQIPEAPVPSVADVVEVPSSETVEWPTLGEKGEPSIRETVVVVDDNADARELLTRHLSRDGFRVVGACNGAEAIEIVRREQPILVTLDVLMPGLDGWEVLAALKADPSTDDIPVVMLTMLNDKKLAFALGAVDFLMKPVDHRRLIALANRFRNNGVITSRILVVEDDPASRELMVRTLRGAGFESMEATNGRTAIEYLQTLETSQLPALILLDLMMPEMDGFEFLDHLRSQSAWNGLPVVVVTAKELTSAEREYLSGRASQILQKGVDGRARLLGQLNRLLKPRRDIPQDDFKS